MLQLFVVDDEKIIRTGIINCLNWSEYGIEVFGEARNGAEALEILKDRKPDILLTDVRMPIMDGIELSRKLRDMYDNVKIIFISGYADLEYLRTAFKIDVEDYILKPVDIEELEKAIKKVSDLCIRENESNNYRLVLEQKLIQSMPFLREKFMKLLVNGEVRDKNEIAERFRFLDIHIPLDKFYSVFVISIDNYEVDYNNKTQFEKQLLSFSIINIVQETMDNYGGGYIFEWKEDEFVCMTSLPVDETLIEEHIDIVSSGIHKNLSIYLQLSITIGVGIWVESIEKINVSYKYARNAVNQKFIMGKNRIIYVDKLYDGRGDNMAYEGYIMELSNAVHENDNYKTMHLVDNIFNTLRNSKNPDIKYIQSLSLQIASIISGIALKSGKNYDMQQVSMAQVLDSILKKDTIDEIQDLIINYIKAIYDTIVSSNELESGNVVHDIKNIINSRYGEDLSINSIAREVYLTPAYICMLFKQDTGLTINEYLTSVRLERAKELLRQGSHKMFEIATLVGYSDHKYFSKLFKKQTGINPSEFK